MKLFYILLNIFNEKVPSLFIMIIKNDFKSMNKENLSLVFAFHLAGLIQLMEIWIKTKY